MDIALALGGLVFPLLVLAALLAPLFAVRAIWREVRAERAKRAQFLQMVLEDSGRREGLAAGVLWPAFFGVSPEEVKAWLEAGPRGKYYMRVAEGVDRWIEVDGQVNRHTLLVWAPDGRLEGASPDIIWAHPHRSDIWLVKRDGDWRVMDREGRTLLKGRECVRVEVEL